MWVINNRKLFYSFSGILVIASIVSLLIWGLNPGIDFSGGTLIDASYTTSRPAQADLEQALRIIDPTASVRPSGESEYIIRMKAIDETVHAQVKDALTLNGTFNMQEKTFDSIGPVLGKEALRKAYVSIALVILGIVLYITFAFRKVSEPVSSWKYGFVAIAALVHDVIIPTGVFSVLGHLYGYEVDTLFVTALLVILGFSVHDTIVVFDRVRENLKRGGHGKPFSEIVGESISQTFTRSINTSLTTLIALVVLYFVGGASTQHFALALIVGIAAGTYSSIFIGSPLLVTLEKWQKGKGK
ncbi:MAG: protein translocase subunit SecF [Patescibacteria group bacterium]|nr:protein translocase subunit SecF [Patescibacteria group bacterium]